MAKKKKTQLKPVARGFAITSVPKKIIPSSTEAASDVDILDGDVDEWTKSQQKMDGPSAVLAPAVTLKADKTGEQELQNLVDKLQEKTDREITR